MEALTTIKTAAGIIGQVRRLGNLARRAFGDNDGDAEAEYNRLIEEMVLELQRFHRERGVGEAEVDREDVMAAAEDLRRAANAAGNDKKRWMLTQAFFGRFDPKLMASGMTNILWDVAKQIEYPEALLLRRLPRGFTGGGGWQQVHCGSANFSLARRLGKLDLVTYHGRNPELLEVRNTALADALIDFIWDSGPVTAPDPEP